MKSTTGDRKNKLGLYIHIPFCIQKCKYCDFHSFACNDIRSDRFDYEEYTNALVNEIEAYGDYYRNEYKVDTVFIGGGTPSVLLPRQIARICDIVFRKFDVCSDVEFTIESNPGTLDKEKLNAYINSGINRISMGVQAFDNNMLRALGRIHDADTAVRSFELIRDCGFKNVNLDLMFSIPGHNAELWAHTLDKTIKLEPEHISFYSLQLEENTPFFDMYKRGELIIPDDEVDREMYHFAVNTLKNAGYHHYEISNAAKPGFECRHNLRYWSLDEYLGLGVAAHSYFKGLRFYNYGDLQQYIDEMGSENGRLLSTEFNGHMNHGGNKEHSDVKLTKCVAEIKENSVWDDMTEFVFTGFRKTCGISFSDFYREFGRSFFDIYSEQSDNIERYCKSGHLEYVEDGLRLTEKGIDISNTILSEFV